ncbi:MAG: hypothetical protein NVS3B19_13280 [Ginsengibacter sp.]
MKAASISEIKNELLNVPQNELIALCLRLAKYKKENKELLTFLLFESTDIEEYKRSVKAEIDLQMKEINSSNLYYVKKGLRKILRLTNKFIKYAASDEVGVELLIYFCNAVKESGFKINKSTALKNLYNGQLEKIFKLIDTLHEDLRYDFIKQTEELNVFY